MLVIRGVNVYPTEIEAVLLADQRVSPHYLLVEDARTAQPRLVVVTETDVADRDPVAARLGAALRDRLGLSCEVALVRPGELPRTEVGKARRLIRWEGGDPPVPGLPG